MHVCVDASVSDEPVSDNGTAVVSSAGQGAALGLRNHLLPLVCLKVVQVDFAVDGTVGPSAGPASVTLPTVDAEIVLVGDHQVVEAAVVFLEFLSYLSSGFLGVVDDWLVSEVEDTRSSMLAALFDGRLCHLVEILAAKVVGPSLGQFLVLIVILAEGLHVRYCLCGDSAEEENAAGQRVVARGVALARFKNVSLRDSSGLCECAADSAQNRMGNLLCVVLLDLVESQEGVLRRELPLEGVEEDLILGQFRFAGLQLAVDLFVGFLLRPRINLSFRLLL